MTRVYNSYTRMIQEQLAKECGGEWKAWVEQRDISDSPVLCIQKATFSGEDEASKVSGVVTNAQ